MNGPFRYSLPAREAEKICRAQEQRLRKSVEECQANAFQHLQRLKIALKLRPEPTIARRLLVWFELSANSIAGDGKPNLDAWEAAMRNLNFEDWSYDPQHPPAISAIEYCDGNVRVEYWAFYEAFTKLVEKWEKWSNKSEILEEIERLPDGAFYNCN